VLIGLAPTDRMAQASVAALRQRLGELGWTEGGNLHIEYRYPIGAAELTRAAAELVALRADIIVARSTPMVAALLRETRTIPIVFTYVGEPVASGFVASFNRPGGSATGFLSLQSSVGSKWPEILKEIVPGLRRIGTMFNPDTGPRRGSDFLLPITNAARALSLAVIEMPVRTGWEIESAVVSLAGEPDTGLIAVADLFTTTHRELIAALANRHHLPSIYPYRFLSRAAA
jgi:putative ABC transport system substrate-binding protein